MQTRLARLCSIRERHSLHASTFQLLFSGREVAAEGLDTAGAVKCTAFQQNILQSHLCISSGTSASRASGASDAQQSISSCQQVKTEMNQKLPCHASNIVLMQCYHRRLGSSELLLCTAGTVPSTAEVQMLQQLAI